MIDLSINEQGVAEVRLNRPEVHHAFNEEMIQRLHDALENCATHEDVRVVVLSSSGKIFCAGADLNWMERSAQFSEEENFEDAMKLAALLQTLDDMPKPTIAKVQGHAFGGGVGLIACCDVAVCSSNVSFSLTEVKLGLMPSIIGPFVIRAMGARAARRYFQTAERFDAEDASRIGFVHRVVEPEQLDAVVNEIISSLLEGGPEAQAAAKQLVALSHGAPVNKELLREAARRIANLRASEEGKEGISAFLNKRKPNWRSDV